jgi:hypothetical protein
MSPSARNIGAAHVQTKEVNATLGHAELLDIKATPFSKPSIL